MIAQPVSARIACACAAFAVLAGVAAGCGGGGNGQSLPAGVVARVDGEDVTQAQVDEVIAQASGRMKAQGQAVPAAGSEEYQAFQQNALQFLVQKLEFEQKGRELGVTVTDKQVDERLQRVLTQFFGGDKKKYLASLKPQGMTDQQVRDELKSTLLSEAIFKKVGESAKVTDADIREYYTAHPELYKQGGARVVRHILVKEKSLADDLYEQLQAGGNFAALAKKHSLDSSKSVGGKLTVRRGETVPEFDKLAFSLKAKQISEPVKTQFGWHVIQALGPIPEETVTPLAKVRQTISDTLLGQEQSTAVTTWLEALRKEYAEKITYAPGFAPPSTDSTTTTSTG